MQDDLIVKGEQVDPVRSENATSKQILDFVREKFLGGDPDGEVTERTPLLEYGILNSLNTAELLAYLRDELDVAVPFDVVNAETFKSIDALSVMVDSWRTS